MPTKFQLSRFPSDEVEQGRCLLEIFNIVYLGSEEVKAENQTGVIKVEDKNGDHFIYNVKEANMNMKSIFFGDEIVLSGPTRMAISLDDTATVHIDLFGHSFKETLTIDWGQHARLTCPEERIVSKDGTGEIAILSGYFANAAEARISFILSTKDKSSSELYGVVTASTNLIESPARSSFLFLVTDQESKVKVEHRQKIPFSRSIVAVPLDSTFSLDVDLYVDGVFVSKSLQFKTEVYGHVPEKIPCHENCHINVSVEWVSKRKMTRTRN